MRGPWRAVTAGVTAIIVLAASAACGGDRPDIPAAVSTQLVDAVDGVREAAVAQDVDTARDRLADLEAAVVNLHRDGLLDRGTAAAVLAAAADVERHLELVAPTTTAPTTTAPPATAPPDDDEEEDDKDDEGDGNGERGNEGNGRGEGNGGDRGNGNGGDRGDG